VEQGARFVLQAVVPEWTEPALAFVVEEDPVGEPRPIPSHSGGRFRVRRDGRADAWKKAVRVAALVAMGLEEPPPEPLFDPAAPLVVPMLFRLARPADHHVARDRRRPVRPGKPLEPVSKPDVDNLGKAVLDALGPWPRLRPSILWKDDQQVVANPCRKIYATEGCPPGVVVAVHVLPLTP
jgi:hypothetical protein